MDTENLLTVAEAAAEIGVTPSAIRNATLEGRLPFVRAFGRKLIERGALADYRARTQVDGAPPAGRPRRNPLRLAEARHLPCQGEGGGSAAGAGPRRFPGRLQTGHRS